MEKKISGSVEELQVENRRTLINQWELNIALINQRKDFYLSVGHNRHQHLQNLVFYALKYPKLHCVYQAK